MLLCFGDSNAWGFQPGGGRYRHDQSWPALLAARLETTLDLQAQPGRTLQAERPQAGLLAAPQAWQQASAIRGFFAERLGVSPVGPLRAQFVVLFAARVAILFPPGGR